MKRILFLAILGGSLSFGANAQASLGTHAGAIFTTSNNKVPDGIDKKLVPGFRAGLIADVPFSDHFSFVPELNFAGKELKYTSKEAGLTHYEQTIKFQYVEVPLNFAYRTAKGGSNAFFVGAGPVLGYGLAGKWKTLNVGEKDETTIKFDGDDKPNDTDLHLKTLEVGVDAFVGYELKSGVFFKAYYSQGLTDLSTIEGADSFKVGYFGISVGGFFRKK